MGSGKCSRKGWAWKSVKPQLLEFGDNDPIGTIKCEIYAQEDSPFCESERLNASEIFGFEISLQKVQLYLRSQSLKQQLMLSTM